MPRWLTSTILLSFIAIAVFGFLGMAHGQSHEGCIAVAARAATCPSDVAAPFADLALHVAAWKGFSATAVPTSLLLAIVTLIAYAVATWCRHRFRSVALRAEPHRPVHALQSVGFLFPTFLRWIAIHERRDPSSPSLAS